MLPEATYDMTHTAMADESQLDAKLYVRFHMHPHPNREKSTAEGRPIFEDRVYIMIMVPGDKESIVNRPAWDLDFRRFPKQHQAFLNKQDSRVVGTPLNALTWLSASQIKEMEYFNIVTVEQLAGVADAQAQKFMGLQGLKQRANDFLAAAKGNAPLLEMRKELDDRDALIAQLSKRLEALEAPPGEPLKKKEK